MSETQETLGDCPDCDVSIPMSQLLIEYESSEGPDLFAECPECGGVVSPT